MANLTNSAVKEAAKPGRYGDGGGLYLHITPHGTKSWVQRIVIDGARLDKGLGGWPQVTLKRAREIADSNRVEVKAGRNPWAGKERAARVASATPRTPAKRKVLTFEDVGRAYHSEIKVRQLDSAKNGRNWIQQMERHVFPIIGDTPVTEIDRPTVLDALKPIWFDLPDAARRIRLRIRETLDYAVDLGLIEVNAERVISKVALPPQPKVKEHRKALLHSEVAGALECVRESPAWDSTKLCFEWMVLTASRPQEALLAQWNEIDLNAHTWTVPASKMKARRGHRQPLSEQALDLLRRAGELYRTPDDPDEWPIQPPADGYIFPHPTERGPLSIAALEGRCKKCGLDCTPHGFRSSFRDWAEEMSGASRNAIELSLAHAVGNQVERAYLRSDLLEQRRPLLQAWGDYAAPPVDSPF